MTTPSHPSAASRPVADILARLSRLRGRIRAIGLLAGIARWVLLAAGLLLLSFLFDWGLDPPIAVRGFLLVGLAGAPAWLAPSAWVALLVACGFGWLAAARRRSPLAAGFAFATAGAVGVLVWAAGRAFLAPFRVRLPDEDLALSVESRFRNLNDRLAAALDFDRELAAPTRGESTAMMAEVVAEAGQEASRLEFSQVASARRARGMAALAGMAVLVVAGVLFASGEAARLWWRRSVALDPEAKWPQATTLLAVVREPDGTEREKDPKTPYVAALSQTLSVLARANGKVPAEVEILDRITAEGREGKPLAHRMRPVAGSPGLFEHEFRDVRAPFSFTLRGGDDRDEEPVWSVVVRVPPRVVGLAADLVFPDYLKMPATRVEGGVLAVPEGTKATVSFQSDVPVAKAEAWVGDDPVAVLGGSGSGPWRFSFLASKTTRYRLRIVAEDGRENDAGTDTYEVAVQSDTPPHAEWVWPSATVETSPDGRVPLFVRTTDDHGITSIRLEVLVGASAEPVVIPLAPRTPEAPEGANDRSFGATEILSYVPLEMRSPHLDPDGKRPVEPGARLRLRVVAKDARDQEGGGEWRAVDVSRKDEIERRLASVRSQLKTDLNGLREEQRGLVETAAALGNGAASDADRGVLREAQFRQGKVKGDVERASRGLLSLFNAYLYGRLGSEIPTEKLLALFDRRHREAFVTRSEAGAIAPSGESEVFPWTLYRETVRARRDRVLFDQGILDKMITVVDAAAAVGDGLEAEAYAAAAEAAARGGAPEVAAAKAAMERCVKALDALLSAMDEWQSLSELTLILKRLVEEQETIHKKIPTLPR